ncbi:MAG: AAA family ATPase [Candidatus Gracilibacteria bacterium]|nr:AAA family ATPase [Candidatus Gracilibacteria bacterium]MDQ7022061.1 AAA family ATPase [Candidatus Gracilibacteria bacterium]
MENNEEVLQEQINIASDKIRDVKNEIHKKIVGQEDLIENLIIGLLAKGHILIEGVPGLAKTLTVDTLSKTLNLGFSRVQFTPDLLPSDLIGTEIYSPKTGDFSVKKGPIFNNFILADEINRAPSKVQSALLEAMAEKQITIGNETFKLDEPFIVLATQNPIEQSGTYRLPEAQLDRFMMKVSVGYSDKETELEMYKKINSDFDDIKIKKILNKKDIKDIQKLLKEIYVSDNIFKYVTDIIDSTRNPENYGNLEQIKKYLSYGISPRGGIFLISAAKVVALLNKRTFVIPEDIKKIATNVLSHRLVLNYEAISDDITNEKIIDVILKNIKVV